MSLRVYVRPRTKCPETAQKIAHLLSDMVNKVAWELQRQEAARQERRRYFVKLQQEPDYNSRLSQAIVQIKAAAASCYPSQTFSNQKLKFLAKCLLKLQDDLERESP